MRKLIFALVLVLFCSGCNMVGWVVNPGPYDRVVPAEFKIKDRASEKVIVIVEQGGGVNAGALICDDLQNTISTMLIQRAKVKGKYLVKFSSKELAGQMDGVNSSPVKAAAEAGIGLVLYTRILDYKLYPSGQRGYYRGSMDTASVIVDSKTGKVVWPADGSSKIVRMEVGMESPGERETIGKLITATSHGIVRNLYDIRYTRYRTSLEKVTY